MNAKSRGGGGVKYCPPSQRRRCHRSTRGQSRSNAADTTRQRAGHQRGLLHSDSTTERNRGARGTTSTGGGRVAAHAATPMPPVDAWAIEQRSRHHPSTCGPSTRTPPHRHHDRTQCRRQDIKKIPTKKLTPAPTSLGEGPNRWADERQEGGGGCKILPPINARVIKQ